MKIFLTAEIYQRIIILCANEERNAFFKKKKNDLFVDEKGKESSLKVKRDKQSPTIKLIPLSYNIFLGHDLFNKRLVIITSTNLKFCCNNILFQSWSVSWVYNDKNKLCSYFS